MALSRLFETNTGRILVSIIFGLAVATLFRKVCNDGKCIVIKGPKRADVDGYHFKLGSDCYSYTPVPVSCDVAAAATAATATETSSKGPLAGDASPEILDTRTES